LPVLLLGIIVIIFVAFGIRLLIPGKPANAILWQSKQGMGNFNENKNMATIEAAMGQHLPLFYISFELAVIPNDLQNLAPDKHHKPLRKIISMHGYSKALWQYYAACKDMAALSSDPMLQPFLDSFYSAFEKANMPLQQQALKNIILNSRENEANQCAMQLLNLNRQVQTGKTTLFDFLPVLNYHKQNQFHNWLLGAANQKGVLSGNFGNSFTTQQPINDTLKQRLTWSVALALLAFIVTLLFALPLGIYTAINPQSVLCKLLQFYQTLSTTIPLFIFATLMLLFFANDDWFGLFPASVHSTNNLSLFWFLLLPLACYCFEGIAYTSQIIATQMQQTLKQMHVVYAKTLGFNQAYILKKHVLPAICITLLSVFLQWIPAAFAGSLIIENVFGIPGIGFEMAQSVYTQNYPMLSSLVLISGVTTIFAATLVDVIQKLINPNLKSHI